MKKKAKKNKPIEKRAQDKHLQNLIDTYFSDPERVLHLKKGDFLMRQGAYNDRLFLVRKGQLKGFVENENGERYDILHVGPDFFIGVYSFFSKTYQSSATVEAESDCEIAYMDSNQVEDYDSDGVCLERRFMPVVVTDLKERQERLQEVGQEKEQALKKLIESEKMASLGQMAAGIAHEINNAVSVLSRNTHWLVEKVSEEWFGQKKNNSVFEAGLMRGRFFSSLEVRRRRKELQKSYHISEQAASLLAQTGMNNSELEQISDDLETDAHRIYKDWELGATFNDMLIASDQTTHVVKSIRVMGHRQQSRQSGIDINETIHNALALLRHRIKEYQVDLDLAPVPQITGNIGELVQVWTNLIKNAIEALGHLKNREPRLRIQSHSTGASVEVILSDNGPGIPKDILPKIFQPNITTKISGLSFGLGLGLTVVQRVINSYNGTIVVKSSEAGTEFNIKLPVGGEHG